MVQSLLSPMTSKQIKTWIKHPSRFLSALVVRCGYYLKDSTYLRFQYYSKLGKRLNLKNPQTFNEKLQWLKLHDRKPEYTTMVDKVEVKKWVADKIGEEYIIPTLGVWERPEDIDFDSLPDQFVLKTNHDSGGVVICKNKANFDKEAAKQKLTASLKRDFYKYGREWPYKNVKPRILAEKYISSDIVDSDGNIPDYKLMSFNGEVRYTFTVTGRGSAEGLKVTFFNNDWERMPFERHYPASDIPLRCPENFDKMKELAETLSKNIKFVRVDFYETDNKIYFGEMTFYPGCGYEEFTPEEWDYKLGELIKI